jgi:hypothetical protein
MSQGPQGSQGFQGFQGFQGPQPVNTGLAHYVEFAHTENPGVNGGRAALNVWTDLTITDTLSDVDDVSSLAGNRFTLDSGRWDIRAIQETPTYLWLRLYDYTHSTVLLYTPPVRSTGSPAAVHAVLSGQFTLDSLSTLAIQYYCPVSIGETDLGEAWTVGTIRERFLTVDIMSAANVGPQGWQGLQGKAGTQGSQGPRGYLGSRGFQGFQGVQGLQAAATVTVSEATATGTITTSSTSDVLATSMTITPSSGTYLVWFHGSSSHSSNGANVFESIYAGGSQVAASEVSSTQPSGGGSSRHYPFACCCQVTVNGAQAIEGRWRTDAATASMYQRTLEILKIG